MSIDTPPDFSFPRKDVSINSFWQSAVWGDILTGTGQAQVILYPSGKSQILIERRSIWRHTTGLYILGVEGDELTSDILDDICTHIASPSDLFLQIEPMTYGLPVQNTSAAADKIQNRGSGYIRAPFRRFLEPTTALIALAGMTEETLIGHFEEKGRYNIRVAQRRGLTAHWVTGSAHSSYFLPGKKESKSTNIELFFSLLAETTERDKFAHNSLSYYRHFVSVLEKQKAGGLLFVTKDNTLHAAGIFVYWNHQAIYYYGASSDQQDIRRDNGTYLLQWEAMQEAMRRNCHAYDFLGISSKTGDKLAGVTAFKMRFAPEKVTLPLEQVIILRPLQLFLLQRISTIRKVLRLLYR